MGSTPPEVKPSSDSGSRLDEQAKGLRRAWFSRLPSWDSDGIIQKEFESRYKTNDSKKKALEGLNDQIDLPF